MHEKFIGEKCCVCSSDFDEQSDVVVCPQCGAPYHRDCYRRENRCIYDINHGEFEWKSKKDALMEHYLNMEEAQLAKSEAAESSYGEIDVQEIVEEISDIQFRDAADMDEKVENATIGYLKKRGYNSLNGVTIEEMCRFVGKNVFYYLPRFCSMAREEKMLDPNFASLLFFPMHLFYRRMNLYGTILMFINALCVFVPKILFSYFNEIASPESAAGGFISMLVYIVPIAVNLFACMFSNYIYFKFMTKKINKIKSHSSQESKEELLKKIAEEGRPTLFGAVAFPVCIFLVCAITFRFIFHQLGLTA